MKTEGWAERKYPLDIDPPITADKVLDWLANCDEDILISVREKLNEWNLDDDLVTLVLDRSEASALSYFVAFSALHHETKSKLTSHEENMINKVARLDPDAYTLWRDSVVRAVNATK